MPTIDIVDSPAGDGLLAAFEKTSRTYLMEKTGSLLNASVGGKNLSLPVFRYDWQIRSEAINLLNGRTVPSVLWWGKRESRDIYLDLMDVLDGAVRPTGTEFLDTLLYEDFLDSTQPAFQWYLENCKLTGCRH